MKYIYFLNMAQKKDRYAHYLSYATLVRDHDTPFGNKFILVTVERYLWHNYRGKGAVYIQIIRSSKSLCMITKAHDVV